MPSKIGKQGHFLQTRNTGSRQAGNAALCLEAAAAMGRAASGHRETSREPERRTDARICRDVPRETAQF